MSVISHVCDLLFLNLKRRRKHLCRIFRLLFAGVICKAMGDGLAKTIAYFRALA